MPTAFLTMENNQHFISNECFDFNSLSGLHTAWMDDEQLNNLPIVDISANDLATRIEINSADRSNTSAEIDSVLSLERGDHDTQLLDEALDFSFDTELSPVLEPFADVTVAISPLTIEEKHLKKSPKTRRMINASLKNTGILTKPSEISKLENNQFDEETTFLAVTKRPRTRSSSWEQQEEHTFFSLFKNKWPVTPKGEPEPPFSTLLLERFDAISTKLRTKSVMDVKQFYTTVVQNISAMLEVVDNDIDLTNPDQIRIAVWCWSKFLADKKYHDELQAINSESTVMKTKLANVLLQSIIRSRRQMLKSKSDNSALANKATAPGLTSISAWVARSNLNTFFTRSGSQGGSETSSRQIHHPIVRKKQMRKEVFSDHPAIVSFPTGLQSSNGSAREVTLKRKRRLSMDSSVISATLKKKSRRDEVGAASFTSPICTEKRLKSRSRNCTALHTPVQESRKKIYIKMRMVPRDKRTKTYVVNSGCRPKVELKLSSTKKISEIVAHMSKKWAKVHPVLPRGAVLCFFQKHSADTSSKENPDVTCLDLWKLSGKLINGENVVEMSYLWMVPDKTNDSANDESVQLGDLMPLTAPPGLFDEDECFSTKQAASSSDECESLHLFYPGYLEESGENIPIDESFSTEAGNNVAGIEALTDYSGTNGYGTECCSPSIRRRRRIKPVLVSKEEYNI